MKKPPRDKPARTRDHRDLKREHLLEAAIDTFCELGFAGATIVEISRRAGVADGTLYLYFKNKNSLWRELFESKIKELERKLEQELKDLTDPGKRVAAFVKFHLNQAAHDPKLLLFLIGCTPHTFALQSFYDEQTNRYWRRFARHVEAALTCSGASSALSPAQAAQISFCALSSVCKAMVRKEVQLGTKAIAELAERFVQLALSDRIDEN